MEVVIILLLILCGVTIYFFKVKKRKKTIQKSTKTSPVQIDKDFDEFNEKMSKSAKKRIKSLAKKK